MIPILSTDSNEPRYRYTALNLPFLFIDEGGAAFRQFMSNPNPYACRSLAEWSAYFGFEVQLGSWAVEPDCIGWKENRYGVR